MTKAGNGARTERPDMLGFTRLQKYEIMVFEKNKEIRTNLSWQCHREDNVHVISYNN